MHAHTLVHERPLIPARRPLSAGAGGFTLIELMVVIAILAILVALVAPKMIGRTDDARITSAKTQIRNIEQALGLYKLDSGVYPSTEQGLESLVRPPTIGIIPRNWKEGGYMPKVPLDPWGNPFVYLSPGPDGTPYEVISYGADGEEGGEGPAADVRAGDLG